MACTVISALGRWRRLLNQRQRFANALTANVSINANASADGNAPTDGRVAADGNGPAGNNNSAPPEKGAQAGFRQAGGGLLSGRWGRPVGGIRPRSHFRIPFF